MEVKQGYDMLFLAREEIGVEDRTKPGKEAKARPVTITAGKKSWKTKLSPEHLQRLIAWKTAPDTSLPDESGTNL